MLFQAATGGLAIAEVMLSDKPDPDYIKYGTDVLTISVLAIIICAPIGATLMAVLGPRFLAHGMYKVFIEHSFPRIKIISNFCDL